MCCRVMPGMVVDTAVPAVVSSGVAVTVVGRRMVTDRVVSGMMIDATVAVVLLRAVSSRVVTAVIHTAVSTLVSH